MSTQLALAEDLAPVRRVQHAVWRGPKLPNDQQMAETLSLLFDAPAKRASIYECPYPGAEEPVATKVAPHSAHRCGLGKHWSLCTAGPRCQMPIYIPCFSCEAKVRAGYSAGRYAR